MTRSTLPATAAGHPVRPSSSSATLRTVLRALRPGQWIKNLLVLAGAVFSGLATEAHVLRAALLGVVAFTFAAGAVYLANDIVDRRSDLLHPTRRLRPIASGELSVNLAAGIAIALVICATGTGLLVGRLFTAILGFYFITNAIYSLGAKRVVIVDVLLVSGGFVLRAVAGAVAAEVAASSWIVVCTLELAMLIVLGKRRVDLRTAEDLGLRHLLPSEWYTIAFLDLLMAVFAGASIVTYSLYTLDPRTVEAIGNRRMVLTLPMVVYGCLRYLFMVHTGRSTSDPSSALVSDWGLRLCAAAWVLAALVAVYL